MPSHHVRAVCVRCGNSKRHAPERCSRCQFTPCSNADLAKSFILSAAFDVGDTTIGRTPDELARIADSVTGGWPYLFSDAAVAGVEQQVAAFRAITPRRLLVSLVRWLRPPLLIIAIAFLLLWNV